MPIKITFVSFVKPHRGEPHGIHAMEEILGRIRELLEGLPPHLRRAGGHILDHPHDVAVSSMRALAASAGVTPPTMLRLARRLGFASYDSFRAVFQDAVTGGEFHRRAASLQRLGEASGEAGIIARMALAARDNIESSFAAADAADMTRAVQVLHRCRRVLALGGGALHWMSGYLEYLSRTVLPQLRVPPPNHNLPIEEVAGIGKHEAVLILSASPYAVQMLKVARLARANGAAVIAITDSRGAPLAGLADVVLVARTTSPQFYPSMVGFVAVIETLVALAVSRGERTVLERIAAIDALRRAEGSYRDS
jgi:DNA-binding MurR/RpiR family transcriptional regulator